MLKIYTEAATQKLLTDGLAFRPSGVGFAIVYAGSVELHINKEEATFQSGSLLLLSGNNTYKIKAQSPHCRLFIVSFDRKKMRQRINFNFNGYNSYRLVGTKEGLGKYKLSIPKGAFGRLLQLCEQLHFYLHNEAESPFKDEIITGLSAATGFIIAGELLRNIKPNEGRNHRKEQITARFLELVAVHFKAEKELKFYADGLFISVKYLSNCVREVTHLPPTRFLAEALTGEAKELLLNTNSTVYAIAEDLQFSDQYAFGKFFKKHTGQSPLQFRKQNQQIDTI